MTIDDTSLLLKYLLSLYPNVRMDGQKFKDTLQVWANEFATDNKEAVGAAVREMTMLSPEWMPNPPQIKAQMREIASRMRVKTPEEDFMDSHGGKTKEEWDAMVAWERSPEGIMKLRAYKQRLFELLNGR